MIACGMILTSPASSQRASPNYTIYFTGVNCLGGLCANMNQKIVVFKDKILWSYDENPSGIVFKNNQTIDLFSDPDNDHTLPPAPPVVKRQTATASGAADRTGVNLLIHREGLDRKDRVVSNYNQEIKVSLDASGSCTVTAWRQFGNVYSTPVSSQFRQGSCHVRFGFVDLPR